MEIWEIKDSTFKVSVMTENEGCQCCPPPDNTSQYCLNHLPETNTGTGKSTIFQSIPSLVQHFKERKNQNDCIKNSIFWEVTNSSLHVFS